MKFFLMTLVLLFSMNSYALYVDIEKPYFGELCVGEHYGIPVKLVLTNDSNSEVFYDLKLDDEKKAYRYNRDECSSVPAHSSCSVYFYLNEQESAGFFQIKIDVRWHSQEIPYYNYESTSFYLDVVESGDDCGWE